MSDSLPSLATPAGPTWLLFAHSAIGQQHVRNQTPCQDAHWLAAVDAGRGVAVVCDGAGSAKESGLGARLAAKKAALLFKSDMLARDWLLPEDCGEWRAASHQLLLKTAAFLRRFAERTRREPKSLACTIIVVVYGPQGIWICHIGDGRAAVRDCQGEWLAAMTPYKGEEANQTIFITSALWLDDPAGVGCRVFPGPVSAFALMSDGCENHAFRLNRYDEANGIYIQLNEPYAPFFEPLREQLLAMHEQSLAWEALGQEWKDFIEAGTPGLAREADDKTMIFGILTPCDSP